MTISGFVAYVKQMWKNKPDRSTPVTAERLLHMEDGIKMSSDAIEKLSAAVISQIINDPEKIASMAALFAVNEKVAKLNSDKENKFDVASNAFTIKSGLTDALDIQNKSGLYSTGPETINLPYGGAYGYVSVSKNTDNLWVFIKFFPTSLDDIYYNFYSGYGEPSWYGWVKQELKPVI